MKLVLLSTDLMITSLAAGVTQQLQLELLQTRDQASAVEASHDDQVHVIVVDLRTAGLDIESLVKQLREGDPRRPRIVAFGPHVHEARLASAREAGCEVVATRGQFDRDALQIISQLMNS
ncbi:MAG: hypothetical protein AAGD11_12220 [Planctomycetota bacterium]